MARTRNGLEKERENAPVVTSDTPGLVVSVIVGPFLDQICGVSVHCCERPPYALRVSIIINN